jgi:hypothetical protein
MGKNGGCGWGLASSGGFAQASPLVQRHSRRSSKPLCIAAGVAVSALTGLGLASSATAQSVSFNDTFGSSSLNSASQSYPNTATPTSTSTNYDIASSKTGTSSIASGDLKLGLSSATTSGFFEAQALFSTDPTPFSLANTGDTLEYDVTFKDTSNVLAGGTSSAIYIGLYNSGGSAPYNTLASSGLSTTTGSTYSTGGTAGWVGYVGRFAQSGGTNEIYTRPAQTSGTASNNQDLIGNNFGSGAYPTTGTTLSPQPSSTITLTGGQTYTADMLISYLGSGLISISETLYNGSGTGGGAVQSTLAVASTTAVTTSFDGLAFGVRNSGTSLEPVADISDISVVYTPATAMPEPTGLGLISLGAGLGIMRRRRRGKA